jgi:hypothetical protein
MLEAKFDKKAESSESRLGAAMPGRTRKMYTTPELLEYGPVAALTQGGGSVLPDTPTTHA